MGSVIPQCADPFYVVAKSRWGDSRRSDIVSGWAEFGVPTGFFASDNVAAEVRLTWKPVPGASEYVLMRGPCADSSCFFSSIGSTTPTVFDDTSASPGIRQFYCVVPRNSCGDGNPSDIDAGSIALPAPTGVEASDGSFADRVQVTWNAVGNATIYDVWRGTSLDKNEMIGSSRRTSYSDSLALEGTTYHYSVAARNSIGAGSLSDIDMGYLRARSTISNRAVKWRRAVRSRKEP